MDTIFFSYSRVDSAFVLKLAKDLREAGVSIWLDQLDIAPGSHWDSSIEKALQSSKTLIIILSKTSVTSENVMDEVSYALEEGKRVIPILLSNCDTPFRLRRLQRIDFTGDYKTGFDYLLQHIKSKEVQKEVSSEPVIIKQVEVPAQAVPERMIEEPKKNSKKYYLIGGGVLLIILVVWMISKIGSKSDDNEELTQSTEEVASTVDNPSTEESGKTELTSGTTTYPKELDIMFSYGCNKCHTILTSSTGPTWVDIAKYYQNDDKSIDHLRYVIINGGSGVWGSEPMPATEKMTEEDAKNMVAYILSLKQK